MYDTPSAKENMKVVKKEQNKECIAKIGPWGGNRGGYCTPKVEPVCLNSITIRTGVTILQGIAFSYSDKYGKPHHAGTWGSHGGFVAAWNFHTILLGPSEYLIKISGTVGMSTLFSCKVVTSITFTTNISVYGPFGREEGTPFHSQLMTNGSIVGFFGRAGGLVDAIGTYVNPVRTEKKGLITKAGPWGGYSGDPFDVDILPRRLVSVVVHSNEAIVSIAFTYSDCNGQQHSAGPWGEYGESQLQDGNIHTIVLGHSEFLKEISGTIGPSSKYPDVVTSLLFVTNTNCYGPFGGGGGAPFCSPVLNNGSIVGFFVNSATQADNGTNSIVGSIGVYMDTTREKDNGGTSSTNSNSKGQINELNKPCITKIGLWGGHEGSPHDIAVAPICLNSITICSGEVVHSLAFSYSDDQGKQQHAGPWGVSDGCFDTIQLEPTEFLTQVSGTVGSFSQYPHNSGCVTSVIFTTNVCQYGPFGRGGGVPFHSPVMNNNGSIVGFFAHSGKGAIDAIGIYVNPGVPIEKRGSVTKVGPWGNHSAKTYDLDVLPQRLISVVVCSGQVIDSLAFTYIGCDGQQHSVGPWGGLNEFQHGSFHTILLGRSEFLKEISGTIKLNLQSTDVVTSLLLVTNTGSHGPFGESEGTPFRSPVQDDSSIVGFFAGAGKNLNALGAYLKMTNVQDYSETPRANQQLQGDLQVLNKALVMKIAPWGGHKGNLKDIEETPLYLNTVTIRSGELVYSLAFSYTDTHGKQHHVGPWGSFEGSSYGSFHTIRLCPSEFLTEVSGTIGFPTRYPANVVTSVKFITNAGRYGPFGAGEGIPFHSPLLRKGSIVGFFAYVGKAFNAIGLYVNPEKQTIREAGLITKVGPWGGDSEFSNDVAVLPEHLISVVVHSGKVINSISFTYSDCEEQLHTAGPWGGMGEPHDGSSHTILLGASEILTGISGTVGQSLGHSDVVTSLLFVTNAGRYGPYGQGGGTRFQSPRQRDGAIVGFFANAGEVIDAIGVYFSPRGELIPEEEDGGSRTSDGTTFRERVEIYLASNVLEHILLNQSAEPTNLPLSLLQQITENFADERIIGRGGFGDVYKGDLQNGRVAVKRLSNSHKIEEEAFNREAISLISVRHKNIVRFLGYCANTESKATIYPKSGSNYVFAKMRERLLCFEYINNGSLDKYITDELRGLEWHTRYQIICGICDGLAYLHKKKGIIHRDIKPANILLDDLMIPKITDFGISKLLDGATHVVASKLIFSPGYCAPEMRNSNVVSMKTDIYSLGVIMKELVTGCMDNPDIKNVLRRWRYRWNKSVNYPAFGCEQVAKCIKIALSCLSESPKNRPDISDIVNMLNTVENANDHSNSAADSSVSTISVYTWELLEPDTLELNFAFEINKRIPCSVQLTNVTDTYVAFSIKTKGDLRYCIKPDKSVVAPRSKCSVMVTLQAREWAPDDMMLKDEFFSIRCVAVREGVTAKDLSQEMFKKKPGQVVDKVKLKVVIEPVTVVS